MAYLAYPRNHLGLVRMALTMNNLAFISATIGLLTLITSVNCQSVIERIQGEEAHLAFPYDCNCTEVTLQHGYTSPFYRSTNPASIPLTPYPESRFFIENMVTIDGCSIHLSINPVHRNDAGTYITQVYKDSDGLPDMHRIGMNVADPPGEASCELREGSSVRDWGFLQCTATIGRLSGLFECYQRGESLPPYSTPTKKRDRLEQTIWVSLSHPVFCCTVVQELPKDQCQCNEFVWVPSKIRKSRITVEPCPTSTYIPDLLTSHIPSADSVLELEGEVLRHQSPSKNMGKTTPIQSLRIVKETVKETVSQLSKWIYVIVFGIFVVIVLCLMTFIKLCHMSPKYIRDKRNDCV